MKLFKKGRFSIEWESSIFLVGFASDEDEVCIVLFQIIFCYKTKK